MSASFLLLSEPLHILPLPSSSSSSSNESGTPMVASLNIFVKPVDSVRFLSTWSTPRIRCRCLALLKTRRATPLGLCRATRRTSGSGLRHSQILLAESDTQTHRSIHRYRVYRGVGSSTSGRCLCLYVYAGVLSSWQGSASCPNRPRVTCRRLVSCWGTTMGTHNQTQRVLSRLVEDPTARSK